MAQLPNPPLRTEFLILQRSTSLLTWMGAHNEYSAIHLYSTLVRERGFTVHAVTPTTWLVTQGVCFLIEDAAAKHIRLEL